MPSVTFQPSGITLAIEAKTTLLDAARHAGVEIDAPCGGKGTCGNCTVRIVSGQVDCENLGVLTQVEIDQGLVPTCQAFLRDSDIIFEAPDQAVRFGGQFSDGDGMELIDPALLPAIEDLKPLTEKINISVPPPQKADGLSDLDRLKRVLQQKLGKEDILFSLSAVRQAADALRTSDGNVVVTLLAESLFGNSHKYRAVLSASQTSSKCNPLRAKYKNKPLIAMPTQNCQRLSIG